MWVTTELHGVFLDKIHRGYDGPYWSTGINLSEKSVLNMWLGLNVEIKWFGHQLSSFLYCCCGESWLTLVTRQRTKADILGTLLKNSRIIREGERKVLIQDAFIRWDYIASTVDEWNMSIQHRWNGSGRENPEGLGVKPARVPLGQDQGCRNVLREYFLLNKLSTKTYFLSWMNRLF